MKNTGIKTGVSMLLLLAFFERLSFKETFDKKKAPVRNYYAVYCFVCKKNCYSAPSVLAR